MFIYTCSSGGAGAPGLCGGSVVTLRFQRNEERSCSFKIHLGDIVLVWNIANLGWAGSSVGERRPRSI